MTQIISDIYWTGHIDWNLRNFHGYATPSGSTYNAYLIKDEAPTLIDTVKHYGFEEMLGRIKQVMDPKDIRYIISNHTEMDHSGTIEDLLKYCPNAEVVCSPKGEEGLRRHFGKDWEFKVVNTGDQLNIGKRTLSFTLMPMVHWPDSMATYSVTDKILFPNDAFGQHYASTERYVDQISLDVALDHAAKYYANIVLPYGAQVLKVLDALKSIDLKMICPSHGLIWRKKEDIDAIVASYEKWAKDQTEAKVVIAYDTMWKSTEQLALKLYRLIEEENIPVKLFDLKNTPISDIMTEILHSKVFLLGSPILNNRMLPTVAALMMYLKGLKTKNRLAFAFGSYGWATVGFKELEESLVQAGFSLITDGYYVRYIPSPEELDNLSGVVSKIKNSIGA